MNGIAREFLVLSMSTVVVLVLVTHYTGAEGITNAVGGNLAGIYKVLEGR